MFKRFDTKRLLRFIIALFVIAVVVQCIISLLYFMFYPSATSFNIIAPSFHVGFDGFYFVGTLRFETEDTLEEISDWYKKKGG